MPDAIETNPKTPEKPRFTSLLAPLSELVLAAMLILGQFPYVPFANTVVLVMLGSISLWLRGSGWRKIGLRRPKSWPRTVLIGGALAIVWQTVDLYAITPMLTRITGHTPDVVIFSSLIGNVRQLVYWIVVSWTFAAFGEEMVYRGYLLNRAADAGGQGPIRWILAAIVSSALFALGHSYQGLAGMIDVGLSALVPVVAYFATGRNLWVPIILHGTGDTLGFLLIYLHKYPGL